MTQIARPNGTSVSGGWTSPGTLHGDLSDLSDATAAARGGGASGRMGGALQDLTDPAVSTGHIIHVRRNLISGTGTTVMELWQGTAGSGTLIATSPALVENSTTEEETYTLSGAEADSITDYTNLEWALNKNGGTHVASIMEYWLEVPDSALQLVGSTFVKAKTFPAGGSIVGGAATLVGTTLVKAATFPQSWIGKPSYIPSAVLEMDTSELKNGARLDVDALDSGATLDYSELTWSEDLTSYLRRGDVDRGAERELQRIDAGTGTIYLDNRTGILTEARPMQRFRMQAVWEGTFYPVFTMFAESLDISFPGDTDQEIAVSLVDGFKIIAAALVSGDYPQQESGARIAQILLDIGWPTPFTAIDQGVADVPAITLDNVSALEHIQQIEFAEGGRFFMSRDGVATFRDRTQPAPDLSTRRWADDGTGMTYRGDLVVRKNDDLIMNDVRLTRPGGVEQTATSLDSQGRYGERPFVSEILLATDPEVLERAEHFLGRFSEAERRIESLVDNAMRHGLWDRVLSREISDPVLVIESQIPVAQVSSLEGIRHEFDFQINSWTITLAVSPTTISVHAILDDPILGVLDSGNVLG